ncbi:galactoside 2-alpha-L-fucosyltransferase-like [Nymphaea colorata]|nr:galactoside 2-alpha-L-fucosyltransferase-like [Nymphaea colorata]
MKRSTRQEPDQGNSAAERGTRLRSPVKKLFMSMGRGTVILGGCLVVLSLFVTLSFVYQDPPLGRYTISSVSSGQNLYRGSGFGGDLGNGGKMVDGFDGVIGGRNLEGEAKEENENSQSSDELNDKLLGGLLSDGFDERTCLSRYQSASYHKKSQLKPSAYLIDRLRKYEALHKKCGPYTASYNKTVNLLKPGSSSENADCQYVVWIANSGLGNKILSIASAFLYALLSNRILLVDGRVDLAYLFCEPFPEGSWLLPPDFPLNQFKDFNTNSPERYGHMLKLSSKKEGGLSTLFPLTFVYVHLSHDYDEHDKLFFCDDEQILLQGVPWLFLRTDNYFVPSLFLMPKFVEELNRLFPEKDTVFYHMGRYLFHPANSVWGMITRFYDAYLAHADERIGIQIRTFDTRKGPFQHVLDQILSCARNMEILPNISRHEPVTSWHDPKRRHKAVLITSLSGGYFEWIRNMYWAHPTVNGDIISVYQPSHEEFQQTEKEIHNMKALAEMYLLSLNDMLITSAWSTFGYVAQGLGGIRPWILYKPENDTAPDPPCRRAMSIEPCFHAPPFYDCKAKVGTDTGKLVPHVKHCEDMSWGLKVVGKDEL